MAARHAGNEEVNYTAWRKWSVPKINFVFVIHKHKIVIFMMHKKFAVPKLILHFAQTALMIQSISLWMCRSKRCAQWDHCHHQLLPRPWCASRIALSSCILPIISNVKIRQVPGERTPATGRTSSGAFLSRSTVKDIEKFHNVPWSRWSCRRGGNCLHCKMIKLI